MIKLAGVLFQDDSSQQDTDKAKALLLQVLEKEPNNSEALLLQGKIYYKLGEWQNAIKALENANKVQTDDPYQGPPKANSYY